MHKLVNIFTSKELVYRHKLNVLIDYLFVHSIKMQIKLNILTKLIKPNQL